MEHMNNITAKNRKSYTTLGDHVLTCCCTIDHTSCKLLTGGIHENFARKILEGIIIEDEEQKGANIISKKTVTSGESCCAKISNQ